MARVIGDLIHSTHFNTVVDDFNVLWQDPKDGGGSVIVYTWDNTLHTTDLDRRKGWGNADMSSGATVSAGTIVLANHYNILASYVNTAEYHRVDASYSPTTHVATGQDVLAADLDPLVNVINGYTVTPTGTAFDLGADATLTPQAVSISNGGTPWGSNDLASANVNEITFLHSKKYKNLANSTKASYCITTSNLKNNLPKGCVPLVVDNVLVSTSIVTEKFYPDAVNDNFDNSVQDSSKTKFKEKVKFGRNVLIGKNVSIGSNCMIGHNTVIERNVSIGDYCTIGSNSIIKSGAIIGGSGFGFHPVSKIRIQHFGNVLIKDNCNIGSNVTIDRAVFDSTIISKNCFIDNLVQIAHNVYIGEEAIIASQSGVAGSTKIGNNVVIGGQAGIAGHLTIGKNVQIAAKSGVTKNISDNSTVAGFPAVDIKKWKISNIKLNKL